MIEKFIFCRLKLEEFFNSIKQIDAMLLHFLTYSIFYPDLQARPQTRLAVLATLIPLNISILALALESIVALTLTLPLWVVAFYEWRLWYWLRKRN